MALQRPLPEPYKSCSKHFPGFHHAEYIQEPFIQDGFINLAARSLKSFCLWIMCLQIVTVSLGGYVHLHK
uniref:WRKY transcription factor 28 n=1 Tax=Rhizophora mucronata TaxID=61149 RepID=A0A2P2P9R4_RHIMU